jgi:hypothetical protein
MITSNIRNTKINVNRATKDTPFNLIYGVEAVLH